MESGDNDNEATAEDDDGFGDDFDDFEEGQEAEDADFGEFDGGFQDDVQSPVFEPSPAPPAPAQPLIVSTCSTPTGYEIESTYDHCMKSSGLLTFWKAFARPIHIVNRYCLSTGIVCPLSNRSLPFVFILRPREYRTC